MKIAAFDVDGTLLIDHRIDPGVIQAIAQWRDSGHVAVAATGKSIASLRGVLSRFGIEMDYMVVYNGTVVTDSAYRVLYEDHLARAQVRTVVEHLRDMPGINLYATTLEGADALVCGNLDDREHSVISSARRLSPAELENERVVLLSAWAGGDRRVLRDIQAWIAQHLEVETSVNSGFLDVMPLGHNKGAGLEWLLDNLGLQRDEVELVTFGDSHNDLSMHSLADTSFSFPHADPEVREMVTHVVPDVSAGLGLFK